MALKFFDESKNDVKLDFNLDLSDEEIKRKQALFKLEDQNSTRPRLVVSDVDEVVVSAFPKWLFNLVENGTIKRDLTFADIFNREEYYLDKTFGIEDKEAFYDAYAEGFYDDLKPTFFGSKMFSMHQAGYIELVLITSTVERTKESKRSFLERYFPGVLVYYTDFFSSEKKSDVIKKNSLNHYSLFIDDYHKNIVDVMFNTDSFGKEFLLPKFGHNNLSDKLDNTQKEIISKAQIKVAYYDNIL
jgi:hypothetical protein